MSIREKGREISTHFMTGVSYMIPIVTAGGLMTSLGVLIGGQGAWEGDTSTITGAMVKIGLTGLGLIVPIIAAYISYSIADKPGLAPAFIGGMIANELGTGFLGGMVVGIITGYLVEACKKIPLPPRLMSVKTIIIIPFCCSLIIGFLLIYVIGTPIAWMTESLSNWLNGMQGTNAIVLAAIIGAMMAVDMGGPINKIANTFGMACFTEGIYGPSTAMLMAIAIPPLGLALATFIGKKYYSEDEIENGRSAIVMGICGITEGAIPFAVSDPLSVIPGIILGTMVTTSLNAAFNVISPTGLATIMALPFTSNPIIYTLCVLAGIVVTALSVNFLKARKYKRENKEEHTEEQKGEQVGSEG